MNALLARTFQNYPAMSLSLSCTSLTFTQDNDDGSLRCVAAQADGHFAAWRLLILTYLAANSAVVVHHKRDVTPWHLVSLRNILLILTPHDATRLMPSSDHADLDDGLKTMLTSFQDRLRRVFWEAIRWLNHEFSTARARRC